jgi:hypothetical protein
MSYSIIDFFISKIPLFVPSIKMLTKWKNVNDRTIQFYWNSQNENSIESNIKSTHLFDPNSDSVKDYEYWLQYADYYQWPFVTVFESWIDLMKKLNELNLNKISQKMEQFNKIREADLLTNWCKILKKVNKSPIPDSYEKALIYFNISSINDF